MAVNPSEHHVEVYAALQAAVEPDAVSNERELLDWYSRSTSLSSTRPFAVVYPRSTEHVQRLVAAASKYKLGLYPISRGCNWGYGDACAHRSAGDR